MGRYHEIERRHNERLADLEREVGLARRRAMLRDGGPDRRRTLAQRARSLGGAVLGWVGGKPRAADRAATVTTPPSPAAQ